MEWISVKDKFPEEEYKEYLTYGEIGFCIMKWYGLNNDDRPREHTGWKLPYKVTHWMPLPEKPNEN